MYNHDYYATLDQAMVKLLKHTALNGLRTLNAIAMYLFMQPIRLCELSGTVCERKWHAPAKVGECQDQTGRTGHIETALCESPGEPHCDRL